MTHKGPKIRFTMTVSAVLTLSSTQLLAQVAPEATQPVTVDPVIAVPDIPPEATTPSERSATSASDPLTAEPTITTTEPSSSTTNRRTVRVTRSAKPAAPVARVSVAAPVAQPVETAAASPGPPVAMPTAPPPPAIAAKPPTQEVPAVSNDMLAIAAAAGLGLLGLIGLGVAMRRRKLRRDEELTAVDQYEPASEASAQAEPLFAESAYAPASVEPIPAMPVVAAPIIATSAPSATTAACVDTAPGSHVEAACGGPTPDNPSLSIKKRLKRAHFFDQREFLVAAGEAAPMAADAGLPDAVEVPESPMDRPA